MQYNIDFFKIDNTSDVKTATGFANNAVIIAKGHQVFDRVSGKLKSEYVKGFQLTGLTKFGDVDIVKLVLSATLADYQNMKGFNDEFMQFIDTETKKKYESGIKAKSFLNTYLSTNEIHRTAGDGKISGTLTFDIPLNETAIKITDASVLPTLKGSALRSGLHHQAKAVLSQMHYKRNFVQALNHIVAVTADGKEIKQPAPETAPETATAKATAKGETKRKVTQTKKAKATETAPETATA